jgi:polyphosphate kinase 2 (PPK2 family)
MIYSLDPRGYKVYFEEKLCRHEKRHPTLWRYWSRLPGRGGMTFYSRSWYHPVLFTSPPSERHSGGEPYLDEIADFERFLGIEGYLIVKLFLHVGKKEQARRLKKLREDRERSWILAGKDLKQNERYEEALRSAEAVMKATSSAEAPWEVLSAQNWRWAVFRSEPPHGDRAGAASRLSEVDLSLRLSKKDYRAQLARWQKKAGKLQVEAWRRGIPVVAVFEGWDAGGKGGAIKRLTRALDPRGYEVIPIAAPAETEKARPHLWRFWKVFPEDGFMTVFDRSWYGRVLVERVEGLCRPEDWQRAYGEINRMEAQLVRHGTVLFKFWMHIDAGEQLRRFRSRESDPLKKWKLTDEDWRNRGKWDAYTEAVEDMLAETDLPHAPWTVVEANCKRYARVKVLRTFCEGLERKLEG